MCFSPQSSVLIRIPSICLSNSFFHHHISYSKSSLSKICPKPRRSSCAHRLNFGQQAATCQAWYCILSRPNCHSNQNQNLTFLSTTIIIRVNMSNQGYYSNQGPQYPQQRYVSMTLTRFLIAKNQDELGPPRSTLTRLTLFYGQQLRRRWLWRSAAGIWRIQSSTSSQFDFSFCFVQPVTTSVGREKDRNAEPGIGMGILPKLITLPDAIPARSSAASHRKREKGSWMFNCLVSSRFPRLSLPYPSTCKIAHDITSHQYPHPIPYLSQRYR